MYRKERIYKLFLALLFMAVHKHTGFCYTLVILTGAFLLFSTLFFSFGITGHAIASVEGQNIMPVGLTFFFLGLVGVYLWLKQH